VNENAASDTGRPAASGEFSSNSTYRAVDQVELQFFVVVKLPSAKARWLDWTDSDPAAASRTIHAVVDRWPEKMRADEKELPSLLLEELKAA
jgi:hypothetical protein